MKILVTGATGKVGSRLCKRLAARGDQVRALVRDAQRAASLLEPRIDLAEGDLTHAASLEAAVRGVDAVVHSTISRTTGSSRCTSSARRWRARCSSAWLSSRVTS